jgi:hypothetical protein
VVLQLNSLKKNSKTKNRQLKKKSDNKKLKANSKNKVKQQKN